MKRIIIQHVICIIVAAVSLALEIGNNSDSVGLFMQANGLLTMTAMFALNIASVGYVLPRLLQLEEQYGKPYALDETKLESLKGVREQFFLIGVVYFLMAVMKSSCWELEALRTAWQSLHGGNVGHGVRVLLVAVFVRAAFFQMVYATYDYSKAVVVASVHPNSMR